MPDRPNILFVFTDQQRPDWLEMNPEIPVRTPNLKALADRGVWFSNAVCPTPLCAPCRSCLVSGNEYDRSGVLDNSMPYDFEQTPYHLRLRDEAGYNVMGCGKFHVGGNTHEDGEFFWGLDGRADAERWGFTDTLFNAGKNQSSIIARKKNAPGDLYLNYLDSEGVMWDHINDYRQRSDSDVWTATFPTSLTDEQYFDSWITRNGLTMLDQAPTDQPWYLEVHYQNPHHPWDITESMHKLYRDPPVDFPQPEHSDLDVPAEIHTEVRRNFAAMLEHLDDCVGQLIQRIESRGELDNTVIVFSSDHGEMLGDYSQWQKLSPLQASLGVPLVIAGAGIASQDEVKDPVTTLDLHASFLEWAGLKPSAEIDSRSMTSYLAGETDTHRNVVFQD